VFLIRDNQNWAVEEDLLRFQPGNPVKLPILLRVRGIPLKSRALRQILRKLNH
jgi:hypothetical protein